MNKEWSTQAWIDYLFWQKVDMKTVGRINELIKDIERNGYKGIGKPEPLKHDHSGNWSRRINDEHRLIYHIVEGRIVITQCRFHYKRQR